MVIVGLEHIKSLNSVIGQLTVDDLLAVVTRLMRETLRPGDQVGRVSGNEFVVLLRDLTHEGDLGQGMQKGLLGLRAPFEVWDQSIHVTASLGGVLPPATGAPLRTCWGTPTWPCSR